MREITDIAEKQKIALGVLLHFKNFCDQQHIKYMLAYGTLLGAVRHKGFIPWDDDIDVMMQRSEYMKLVALYNNALQDRYKLICPHNNTTYFAPLAKMYDNKTIVMQHYGQKENNPIGLYVDIFIIEDLPTEHKKIVNFYNTSEILRFFWAMSVRKFNAPSYNLFNKICRIPISICCKLIGTRWFILKYDAYCSKYQNTSSTYKGVVIYGEGYKKEVFPAIMFDELSTIVFEGVIFSCPHDTATYLSKMYGDYMTLPKESDRKVHKNNVYKTFDGIGI